MISFNAGSVAVQVTVSVTVSGNARVSWANYLTGPRTMVWSGTLLQAALRLTQ